MKDINDYILLPKSERQSHLRLDEKCIERGTESFQCRGLLAYFLDTTVPRGHKIILCHACHNRACSNPHHLYWGTASENEYDARANGKKTAHEYTVAKHGPNFKIKRDMSKAGKGNLGTVKADSHKEKISKSIKEWHLKRKQGSVINTQ